MRPTNTLPGRVGVVWAERRRDALGAGDMLLPAKTRVYPRQRSDYAKPRQSGSLSHDTTSIRSQVTALESVGITINPTTRTFKRLPAVPLK